MFTGDAWLGSDDVMCLCIGITRGNYVCCSFLLNNFYICFEFWVRYFSSILALFTAYIFQK